MSCLSIKGTMKGLVICIEGNSLFDNIKSELINKLEAGKGFFKEASFCLHGDQNLAAEQRQVLINLCLDYGMVFDNAMAPSELKKESHNSRRQEDYRTEENIVINRNVRSGQKIVSKKNLVIVGNVNPGAEIVAEGSIVVMGSLRGVAHAGSEGDLYATITAQEMLPSQIRIAGMVACKPETDMISPAQTEIAYVKDNEIIVEKYSNTHKIFKTDPLSA